MPFILSERAPGENVSKLVSGVDIFDLYVDDDDDDSALGSVSRHESK